jgi:selenocysteine lyase/cysteine desulfurase
MPTMLMPLKELIAVCRRHKTLIFIDGAHSPGQVDLDLENLGADFYAGCSYKNGIFHIYIMRLKLFKECYPISV